MYLAVFNKELFKWRGLFFGYIGLCAGVIATEYYSRRDIIDSIISGIEFALWLITAPIFGICLVLSMIYYLLDGMSEISKNHQLLIDKETETRKKIQNELVKDILVAIDPLVVSSLRTVLLASKSRPHAQVNHAQLSIFEYSAWINKLTNSDMRVYEYKEGVERYCMAATNAVEQIYFISQDESDKIQFPVPDFPFPLTNDNIDIQESMKKIDRDRSADTIASHNVYRDRLQDHLGQIMNVYNTRFDEIADLGKELGAKYEHWKIKLAGLQQQH